MQNAAGQVDPPQRDPNSPMPHKVTLSKTHNKEKSHKKYLESRDSMFWTKTPRDHTKQPTRRSEDMRTLASSQQTQTYYV